MNFLLLLSNCQAKITTLLLCFLLHVNLFIESMIIIEHADSSPFFPNVFGHSKHIEQITNKKPMQYSTSFMESNLNIMDFRYNELQKGYVFMRYVSTASSLSIFALHIPYSFTSHDPDGFPASPWASDSIPFKYSIRTFQHGLQLEEDDLCKDNKMYLGYFGKGGQE